MSILPSSSASTPGDLDRGAVHTILRTTIFGELLSMILLGWSLLTALAWGPAVLSTFWAALIGLIGLWIAMRSVGVWAGRTGALVLSVTLTLGVHWGTVDGFNGLPKWLSTGPFSLMTIRTVLLLVCAADAIDCWRAVRRRP